MSWKTKLIVVIGAAVVVATVYASYEYCHRTVVRDNPILGLVSYEFQWCKLTFISCDVDRDGVIDARGRVISFDNKAGTTGFSVIEGWESSGLDGFFDLYYRYVDDELVLDIDRDHDGRFEERFRGEAAERILRDGSLRVLGSSAISSD